MVEFITDCLRLIVGGNLDPHELESLLEYELETHHKEAAEPGARGADASPMRCRASASSRRCSVSWTPWPRSTVPTPARIGRKVGAALVGTFLGILVAYGFVGPIAAAIEHRAHEEGKAFEVVKMALVASVRGYAPPVAVEFARKLLWSDVRPSFAGSGEPPQGQEEGAAEGGRRGMNAHAGRAPDPDRQARQEGRRRSPRRRLEGRLCRLRDRDDGVLHGDVAGRLGLQGAARGDLRLLQEPEHGAGQVAKRRRRARWVRAAPAPA